MEDNNMWLVGLYEITDWVWSRPHGIHIPAAGKLLPGYSWKCTSKAGALGLLEAIAQEPLAPMFQAIIIPGELLSETLPPNLNHIWLNYANREQ